MRSAKFLLASLLALGLPGIAAAQDNTIKSGAFKVGQGEFEGQLACRNGAPFRGILVAKNSMTDDSKLPHSILKVEFANGVPSFGVYNSDGKREEAVRGWNKAALDREFQKPDATDGMKRSYGIIMGQFNRIVGELKEACTKDSAEPLKAATGRSLGVYASVKGLEDWASQLGREYRAGNR